jgi:signal transduction histidine kinase
VALVSVATAAAALIAVSGDAQGTPALVAAARAAIVGIPIAVGLGIWLRAANDRFGPLLVAVGGVCLLTTLSESSDEALYTLGRASGWFLEVLLVYVILSFPTGRLPERGDRLLVGAMGLVVVALFVPRLLIAESFQVPSPYTSCTSDCPGNALFVLDGQPGLVDSVIQPLGNMLVVVVMTAVLVRLWLRLGDSTALARRMLVPVLAVGAARLAMVAAGLVVRDAEPGAWVVSAIAWAIPLAVPLLALAFLLGFVRWRLFIGDALERFAELLREATDADGVRKAFATAFRDPSAEIASPARDGPEWFDSLGNPIALPGSGVRSRVTLVQRHGATVAAVIHDAALETDPRVVAAAAGMAGLVLDNQRLAAETDAAMREVRRSRGRIAATAERERRRIERDLHDSAQQRLVALRIELELAEDLVRRDPERGIERLRELEVGIDEVLEEIRSLAHGVYPPLLADRGLAEALQPAARHCTIQVRLETFEVGRYTPEVESAVYFCVLEALQNAMKHAAGARTLWVRIDGSSGDALTFSVRDDGAGAPGGHIEAGMGIVNMRDRLHSVGGELEINSAPGVGTTVRGRLPSNVSALGA